MGLADVYINAMIGLGLGNMFSRTITLGGLGFALQYFIKPSISYTKVSTKSGEKSIGFVIGKNGPLIIGLNGAKK